MIFVQSIYYIHLNNIWYVLLLKEFDGSDSGASPDEAVSWGKIKIDAKPVKVSADASIVFPLIVSQTFVKEVERLKGAERLLSWKVW